MGSFPLRKLLCHPQAPAAELLRSVGCSQGGSTFSCCDCLLPPKAGEHRFLSRPTSPLARSLVLLPTLPHARHTATGTRRAFRGDTHGGATSREVPRVGLSPRRGDGVQCCMAAGISGSRTEHLGPTDTRRPRESGGSPEGIQGAKLSNAPARRLRSTRLGRPGTPVQSPLLK